MVVLMFSKLKGTVIGYKKLKGLLLMIFFDDGHLDKDA
jgi:hypothetical protein